MIASLQQDHFDLTNQLDLNSSRLKVQEHLKLCKDSLQLYAILSQGSLYFLRLNQKMENAFQTRTLQQALNSLRMVDII